MPLTNRSTRSTAETNETPTDADAGGEAETSGRSPGGRTLRRGLLLLGAAAGAGAAVAALRRRRPKREFTRIELDGDPDER